jgi:hypothetical protein
MERKRSQNNTIFAEPSNRRTSLKGQQSMSYNNQSETAVVKNSRQRVLWVTCTAIFLALLIVIQVTTRPLGNTFITGSLVNMLLILSALTVGVSSSATLCVLAPLFALVVGHGPLPPFLPVIILGNLSITVIWYALVVRRAQKGLPIALPRQIVTLAVGAAVKFGLIYCGIVLLVVPMLLKLPPPQANIVSAAFSWPQLITALIGGAFALMLAPLLNKALKL